MKVLRVLLVLLLVVLLPVRGVMAAAMLCPQASHGAPVTHQMPLWQDASAVHHHAAAQAAGSHHHHPVTPAADQGAEHAADGAGHAGGCSLCAAFCSMTPMPSATPAFDTPALVRALAFPVLEAPSPTFESDGPERPPRSR